MGVGEYVHHHEALSPTSAITIAAWVSLDVALGSQTQQCHVAAKSDWDNKDGYSLLFNQPYTPTLDMLIEP